MARTIGRFESVAGGYERVSETAVLDDGRPITVQVYRTTTQLAAYASDDDWSEAEFREIYLDWYVKERIVNLRKSWAEDGLVED